MADFNRLARIFVRAAKLRATALGGAATPKSVLEGIVLGQFTSTATNGRTVISTSEAGGTTTFTLPADLGPADVMSVADEALSLIESSANPLNPTVGTKRIQRLRVSFGKAAI